MHPDMEPPDQNHPRDDQRSNGGPTSPRKLKKSWAEIVHDDIKKVTQEEVDRMAEAFENERKKWNDGRNVIKNDYGIRRRYIEQLRDMQSKVKKEELKYNIMKIKIKLQENDPQINSETDITKNHWRIKKVTRLVFIEMLGQRNKKLIIDAKEEKKRDKPPSKFDFIIPVGEFALHSGLGWVCLTKIFILIFWLKYIANILLGSDFHFYGCCPLLSCLILLIFLKIINNYDLHS